MSEWKWLWMSVLKIICNTIWPGQFKPWFRWQFLIRRNVCWLRYTTWAGIILLWSFRWHTSSYRRFFHFIFSIDAGHWKSRYMYYNWACLDWRKNHLGLIIVLGGPKVITNEVCRKCSKNILSGLSHILFVPKKHYCAHYYLLLSTCIQLHYFNDLLVGDCGFSFESIA